MSERLEIERLGAVARLTFANPPYNHATVVLLRAIGDALDALDADPEIRVVILASEGRIFCAGADLVSDDGFKGLSEDPLREFYDQALRIFDAKKPIVAAIQGAAVGAGLGIAVAADFRIASPEARFSANFVKLAFHPGFALSYTLPRLIGPQRAATMLLTGDRFRPDEDAVSGLVDKLVADGPSLAAATLDFANRIAVNGPLSLLATRATLRAGIADQARAQLLVEYAGQKKLSPTEDHAEGVRAVAERRPGNFKGR